MDESPATRAELVDLLKLFKRELKEELKQELSQELSGDLSRQLASTKRELVDHIQETVRDAQTEILKAFRPFQEGSDLRIRAVEVKLTNTDVALTERMHVMERRLWEIEKRLLINPPAA
jgi:hypothetical protein